MPIKSLDKKFSKRQKDWPSDLSYSVHDIGTAVEITVSDKGKASDAVYKKIDPWGLAFLDEVKKITDKPLHIKFLLSSHKQPIANCQYEALKRRLSYLSVSNSFIISLFKDGLADTLYSKRDLTNRPSSEITRKSYPKKRDDNDTPGRLEKDFQIYLFGKGLPKYSNPAVLRTNERLALFGKDFVKIGKNPSKYKVEREFPTGVFNNDVKEANRLLSTEYVDLVTINNHGALSVIEIKFDDHKLEVIPQVLNYALFFNSYRLQLTPLLNEKLACDTSGADLVTYLVSNIFHKKFKAVWNYYCCGSLVLKQVVMGHMP